MVSLHCLNQINAYFMSTGTNSSHAATICTCRPPQDRRQSLSKFVECLFGCMALVLLMLPCAVRADARGDKLVEQADSLYGVQQYKEALKAAHEALPLTKGTESEADCLNLLAIINIRLSDYEEAARYAKECYAIDERSGDPDVISSV